MFYYKSYREKSRSHDCYQQSLVNPSMTLRADSGGVFRYSVALEFELKKYDKSLSLNDAREFEFKIWPNIKSHD